ncbi:MAG: hypothetical protein RI911_223 [Candidatus Parcubacteria bacterium]|jgi:hypothetical protein
MASEDDAPESLDPEEPAHPQLNAVTWMQHVNAYIKQNGGTEISGDTLQKVTQKVQRQLNRIFNRNLNDTARTDFASRAGRGDADRATNILIMGALQIACWHVLPHIVAEHCPADIDIMPFSHVIMTELGHIPHGSTPH